MGSVWGRVAIVAAVFVILSGCKEVDGWIEKLVDPIVEARVATATQSLRADVDAYKKKLTDLESAVKVGEIVERVNRNNYKNGAATLDSDCQHYAVARTNLGAVVVTCEGLSPYLDGFKVNLRAAMLVPIEVKGLKVTVTWYESDPKFQEAGKGRVRTKEVNVTQVFQPGRYGAFEVPLTPASTAGVKSLAIEVVTDEIRVLK